MNNLFSRKAFALLALICFGFAAMQAAFVGGRTDIHVESIYFVITTRVYDCLLYTYPSPADRTRRRMPDYA